MKKVLLSLICLLAVIGVNAATATFDWTAPEALSPAQQRPADGVDGAINLDGVTFTDNDVTVAFAKASGGTDTRLYLYKEAVEIRAYKGNTLTVTAPEGKMITEITFDVSYENNINATVSSGEITTGKPSVWKGEANSVTFSWTATSKMNSMTVTYDDGGGEDPEPPTPPATTGETATFDWTNPEALNPAQQKPADGVDGAINLDGVTFTDNDVTVAFAKASGGTDTRLYLYKEAVEIRAYKGNTMTVTAPEGKMITEITFDVSYADNINATVTSGEITTGKPSVWKGEANSVTFSWTATSKMNSMTVVYDGNGDDPNPPTPPTPGDGYASLAEWMAAKPAADAELDATLTAIYQDGKDLWVCENGTYALVYGALEQKYNNGDRIPAPVSGKYEEYNGMPEFVPVASTFGAGEAGETVAAQAMEISDITVVDAARYIRLEGVKISATDNELNFEATDGTNTVVLRNRYSKSITIPVTDDATVYGFVGVYNETIQIYPILIEDENPGPGPDPEATTATFDFNDPSSLSPAQAMPGEGADGAVNLTNVTLSAGNVAISFNLPADLEGKSKDPRLYLYKGNSELRMYSGTSMTVATTDNSSITRIEFQVSYADNINANVNTGEITTGKPSYWDGNAQSVTFDWTATSKANKIIVTTTNGSGIESVEAIELTPAVYYNLQGMRVNNPANGIFIRVQGNNVEKVLVK